MTRDERRALLGDAVLTQVRAEARRAAEEHPPGEEVIAALRPILTANARRPARQKRNPVSAPIAA